MVGRRQSRRLDSFAGGFAVCAPRLGLASADNSQTDSNGGCAMDAKYFREKAELCLRLADGLSVNNPGRFQLMDLADDFLEKAKELEANKVKEESIRHEAA
jgi:hypothetical protein